MSRSRACSSSPNLVMSSSAVRFTDSSSAAVTSSRFWVSSFVRWYDLSTITPITTTAINRIHSMY